MSVVVHLWYDGVCILLCETRTGESGGPNYV